MFQNRASKRQLWCTLCSLVFVCIFGYKLTIAQDGPREFLRLEGKHIVLITDLPPSEHILDLPKAFDAAVEQWTDLFNADRAQVDGWSVEAFIMTDRTRFENAGLMPATTREFREGHQEFDKIYCKEQPSPYYRRHLLLHEGVHWFMWKALGGTGPGWWMEGIAEWQATHRWDGSILECGVMPASREELPYWGRLKWVQQDFGSNEAPSVGKIIHQAKNLHRIDSTYAWSWMLATFFANHPRYKSAFYQRLTEPTDFSDQLNKDVRLWIGDDMDIVQAEFNGFATCLGYGIAPQDCIVDLKQQKQGGDSGVIAADKGWQVFASELKMNTSYSINASGAVALQSASSALTAHPQGITLQYVQGEPLGKLLAAVVPKKGSAENTIPWKVVSVGVAAELDVEVESYLLLRVNGELANASANKGGYEVTLVEHSR